MIKVEEIKSFLLRCSVEPASRGGTFCRVNGGGFGFADAGKIEQSMRAAGAVWARCTTKETGWGDKIRVSVIFREPVAEVKEIISRLEQERERETWEKIWEDGTVSIRRHAYIEMGVQRWKRGEGFLQVCYNPGRNSLSWFDSRDPSNHIGFQKYETTQPTHWFNHATRDEWTEVIGEARWKKLLSGDNE